MFTKIDQKMNPDLENSYQKLYLILNVIQFSRWVNSPWDANVLNQLINHFTPEVFMNVCTKISLDQFQGIKTKDSGGYGKSFNTIYYDIRPYEELYVKEVLNTLNELGNAQLGGRAMCGSIKNNNMFEYQGKRIIAQSCTGNGVPLFLDREFIKKLKTANPHCYEQYLNFIKDNDMINQTLFKIIPISEPLLYQQLSNGIGAINDYFYNHLSQTAKGSEYGYLSSSIDALLIIERDIQKLSNEPKL
jgi:hypothetical protein